MKQKSPYMSNVKIYTREDFWEQLVIHIARKNEGVGLDQHIPSDECLELKSELE